MSKVSIKKMSMHYFKGIKSMEVEFGQKTLVAGPNASGKSTIMDAFFWCLWGKNSKGESDTKFQIKTVDKDGNEIPNVNHEVEMTFDVDGQEVKMKRILIPEYNKDGELKGNHTEYFFNEVPCKKSEYDKKVASIVDEQVFKLIASPFAFLSMDWKQQREILVRIAGDVEDTEIAKQKPEFAVLLAQLTGKTLEEYKKELNAKLTKIKDAMKDIPARIDEVKRGIPGNVDFVALNEEKVGVENAIAEIDKAIADREELSKSRNAEVDNMRRERMELVSKQSQILMDAQAKERNAIHEANNRFDKAKFSYDALKQQYDTLIDNYEIQKKHLRELRESYVDSIMTMQTQMTDLRNEWMNVNAESFNADENLVCPVFKHNCTCGEACRKYEESQSEAYDLWKASKSERLASISRKGQSIKADQEALKAKDTELDDSLGELQKRQEEESTSIKMQMEEFAQYMQENPRRPLQSSIKGEDIPEWVALKVRIDDLTIKIDSGISSKVMDIDEDFIEQKKSLMDSLGAINQKLAVRTQIDAAMKRIAELEEELKTLGNLRSEYEYKLNTIEVFELTKINAVTKKVNEMFGMVKWQMFQRQVNGDLVPACIALVDGVRWDGANTAAKLNAGIDVASCLTNAYGVSAPMFIDNAECVGYIYNPGTSQRILLEHDRSLEKLKITTLND